jgi:colanic acid/amylovoran biosynthesis glycosyltransferase
VNTYDVLKRTIYRDSAKFTMPRRKCLRALKGSALLDAGLLNNPRAALNSLNVFRLGKEAARLGALYKTAPFFKSGAYDIVHCHIPKNGQLAIYLGELGAATGSIVTSFHGYTRQYFTNERRSRVFDDLSKQSNLFLTCSEHMKQWYDQISGVGEGELNARQFELEQR